MSDRPLCLAILSEWLRREKGTRKLLLRCPDRHTFRVPENYILKKYSSPGVGLERSDSQSPCADLGVAFQTSQSPVSIHLGQKSSDALELAIKNQMYQTFIQCQNQVICRPLTKTQEHALKKTKQKKRGGHEIEASSPPFHALQLAQSVLPHGWKRPLSNPQNSCALVPKTSKRFAPRSYL